MQLECIGSRKLLRTCILCLLDHIVQNGQTSVNRCIEALFLHLNNLANVLLLLNQSRICAAAFVNNRITYLVQERLVDAEQLAMTGSAAQQTAQHVAAAFVGRDNAVANHHNRGTDMVGDNAQRYIGLVRFAVRLAGNLRHVIRDILNGIYIEQGIYVLHNNSQTLQAHAGVDVFLNQVGVVAVAIVVELGEYVVPYFHITVAVTAYGTTRLAAAILFTAVKINLRARAARTGAMLPEVIFLAKTENAVRRHTDLLVPNLKCLVIVFIDRRVQTIFRNFHYLGQKLPAPSDGFFLEVIAKREVAEHLEEGTVTSGLAYVLDVAGTDTFLAGRHATARRLLLTGKVRLQRCHAGIDQQQGLIALRDQRKARQTQMAF